MINKKVLIIEDDEDIQAVIQYNLRKAGFLGVFSAEDGLTGFKMTKELKPNIILLDLMLPGLDGISLCRRLKSDDTLSAIPVIMITAKSSESDFVAGLEAGADDYVVKPFSLKVLIARIKSVLRRAEAAALFNGQDSTISRGALTIDIDRRQVHIDGTPVTMTFSEFEVLLLLARSPGRIFSRNQIVNRIKGDDYPVTERAIDVQIVGLRKKLGDHADLIETVRGVGYRFTEHPE
jgi:two-component system phosphate regulon response regulator PhoB